ncbi:MAG: redox-sensing transcriptional repressor Rex [Pirellulaceae bacterium]
MDDTHSNSTGSSGDVAVPKAVVGRLSLYCRELQHLVQQGQETINSAQLGKRLGVTDAQVRKDLAYFGQFGYPGIGYRCAELVEQIRKILGTTESWAVVLVGVGSLGHALLRYRGFAEQGFRIVAALDVDPQKVGQEIASIRIRHLDQLAEVLQEHDIRIAILAVPSPQAQRVARQLVEAGIVGILNFAPVTLTLPDDVAIAGVDLAIELEQLVFAVVKKGVKP